MGKDAVITYKTKEVLIIGFAIFSSLFGAGNLILPPYLGFNAGNDWWLVGLGFLASAMVIPILAVLAHAKLQGTMLDFGNKVSPWFSVIFCSSIYLIAISLPIPRTASVTHELAVGPTFGTSPLLTSSVYFILVLLFVLKRDQIVNLLGKFLTPFIILILVLVITLGLFGMPNNMTASIFEAPFAVGLLEGYQTYDALGGLLIGGVITISLNLKGNLSYEKKRRLMMRSGMLAGFGLLFVYLGLILVGALNNGSFDKDITRSELLMGLAQNTLGDVGGAFLGVLVALACFTTAVSVIVGAADFFKGLFKDSQHIYTMVAIIACILGVAVGQLDVRYIIQVAFPALVLIYPLAVVLILLNILPEKYIDKKVFRTVIVVTFLFSLPDFLEFLMPEFQILDTYKNLIPLTKHKLGWLLPALLSFGVMVLINRSSTGNKKTS